MGETIRASAGRVAAACDGSETVHGDPKRRRSGTVEYAAWQSMKTRCYNPRSRRFDRYGGRGIRVCERWLHSFDAFLADMGRRPGDGYTLDRVDGDKDYGPDNCRWSTWAEQNNNKSDNVYLTIDGVRKCAAAWARTSGISYKTVLRRVRNGATGADALAKRAPAVLGPVTPTGFGNFCRRGHERTEKNTRTDAKGHRTCRPCAAIRSSKYYAQTLRPRTNGAA